MIRKNSSNFSSNQQNQKLIKKISPTKKNNSSSVVSSPKVNNNRNLTPNKINKKIPLTTNKKELQIQKTNMNTLDEDPELNQLIINSNSPHINQINNPNSRRSPSMTSNPVQAFPSLLDASELLFNINDDHKSLITKNTKLRTLLIQASNKLAEVSENLIHKEEEFKKEKSSILEELDRITINYQTYAEGYKKYTILEDQHLNLQKDYQHNYNVLISYGESLSLFLKDYITMYKLFVTFLNSPPNFNINSRYSQNPANFISDIRDLMFENLNKYKNTVDVMNFQEIFDEYTQIICKKQEYIPIRKNKSDNLIPVKIENKIENELIIQEYNLPLKKTKSTSSLSPNRCKSPNRSPLRITNIQNQNVNAKNSRTESRYSRSPSSETIDFIDATTNRKNKCIEYIESHIKNYFDQSNTKNELKEIAESINSNLEKINNNLISSKESLNNSHVSNIFEKHQQLNSNREREKDFNTICAGKESIKRIKKDFPYEQIKNIKSLKTEENIKNENNDKSGHQ